MRGRPLFFLLSFLAAFAGGASLPSAADAPSTPIPEAAIPRMKPGLWNGTVHVEGEQAGGGSFCSSGDPVIAPRSGKCSRYDVVRTAAGAIVSDTTCVDADGITWVTHGVIVGDPNTAFTQDGVLTRNAPGKPAQVIKGHMSFSYVGACPAAAKPGS
jgi:hypothetical protein